MSTSVFVDLGSHNGQTILKAIEVFPDCVAYHGVEPIQGLADCSEASIPAEYREKVTITRAAVDALPSGTQITLASMVEDLTWTRLGSSLLPDKSQNAKREVVVLCLDVSWFLEELELLFPEARVILKIDIEGKEYDILDRLLDTGFLQRRVDLLFVEWHWHKTKTISEERHWKLLGRLNAAGFPLTGHSSKDEFWSGEWGL
jgi:FkbM family methyltransferase